MDGFDISTERIASTAAGVAEVSQSLRREIATMHDLLAEISASWQSSAAAPRFAAAMSGYLDDAATLQQALVGQGQALADSGRAFDRTEAAIAQATPLVTS